MSRFDKLRALAFISLAELLTMSLWFSATAVAPALRLHWSLGDGQVAWLTMSVQLGFVIGALLSALANLADILPARLVIAGGALAGALANAAIAFFEPSFHVALALRLATGAALALVYPVGMKIIATWTTTDRGFGIGLLVGALTVGTASPHLIRWFGGIRDWNSVLYVASALAVTGAVLVITFGKPGPHHSAAPRFEWRRMGDAFRVRSVRLANFGYLGHMWELYSMWTWIPAFMYVATGSVATAAAVSFAVIAVGGVSSVLAGSLADRWGRTNTTITSLAVSGTCALLIGPLRNLGLVPVVLVALLWGFAVVADSAQYSTAVSELSDRRYTGTMLTTQTASGFLLTLLSIRVTPVVVDRLGWNLAFGLLALGPAFGIWAMWRLKRLPEAAAMAGGNR